MSTSAFAQNRDKQYDFTTYDLQGNNIGGDTVTANNLSRQFGMQLREAKAFGLGVREKRNSCEYGTIDMRQYPNYINPS